MIRLFKIFFLFIISFNLSAIEYFDGNIKLKIHEKTGSFSLYRLSDPYSLNYEPLFNDIEPRASYLSVNIDGNTYKLGHSNSFRIRVEKYDDLPLIIFESVNVIITKSFSWIRTFSSQETNGIKLTISVQNTGGTPVSAGLRILLDTHLGEGNNDSHFITNRQMINRETLFRGDSSELFWISKNNKFSLMGSIADPIDTNARTPDIIHFANWRRLYNVPWTLNYSAGRSFNYRPYSIQDSAVCYFYEPAFLEVNESFIYSVYLTSEDLTQYGLRPPVENDFSSVPDINTFNIAEFNDNDLVFMYMLQETLNKFIAGEIYLDEQDLDDIEKSIDGFR